MLRIYKASAGSGKTYTLARQYLKLLLGYRPAGEEKWRLRTSNFFAHRSILAITFTNKATREMVRRIIDELAVLAGIHPDRKDEKSAYLNDFVNELNTDAKSLAEAAHKALFSLLFDFGFFHVSTIDAFFQTVLRTFAREIEMPDNFELELDNKFTISLGVDELFNSVNYRDNGEEISSNERKWLKKWMERYMNRMLTDGKSINLFSRSSSIYTDLVSSFTALLNEDFRLNISTITGYLSDRERLERFEQSVMSKPGAIAKELKILSGKLIQMGHYPLITANIRNCIDQWAEGKKKDATDGVISSVAKAETEGIKVYCKKDYFKLDRSEEFERLTDEVCRLGVSLTHIRQQCDTFLSGIGTLGLLGCLLRVIENYCKDNNIIMLNDTNSLLHDIITVDETPFIYDRMGVSLRHFLIDEFQDTSKMQWHNLKPLLVESMANGHDNLIIGDEKQCIYRFRNSDPELLGSYARRDLEGYRPTSPIEVRGDTIDENTNWRSSCEVVRFNNTLFRALARVIDRIGQGETALSPENSAENTYNGIVQRIPSKHSDFHGYVKLIYKEDEKKNKNKQDAASSDGDSSSEDVNPSKVPVELVEEISRQLSSGYRPKDIAVLVRTHAEGEAVISRLLDEMKQPDWPHGDIEIVSTDSMSVSASAAVKIVISILRLAVSPSVIEKKRPDGSLRKEVNPAWKRAKMMQRFEFYLHSSDLDGESEDKYAVALRKAIDDTQFEVEEILKIEDNPPQEAPVTETREQSDKDRKRMTALESTSLLTIIDRIIERYISPDMRKTENIFLTAFLDLAYDFTQRGVSDIRSFLLWWDNGGKHSGISASSETNAINVMTIHQSKGLEFPCVHIPFADWEMVSYSSNFKPSYGWYEVDKERLDFGCDNEDIPPLLPLNNKSSLQDIVPFERQAREYAAKQRVDSLNIAYVAFTRAVNELIVICRKQKKDNQLGKNIEDAIALINEEYADNTIEPKLKKWLLDAAPEKNSDIITIGEPTIAAHSEPDIPKENDPLLADIQTEYQTATNDRLKLLTAIEIEIFDFDNPRHLGNFLHNVLSRVRRPEDLDVALRRAAYKSLLSAEQTEWCRQTLERAISFASPRGWFDRNVRVYNEYGIGGLEEGKRPDRIVMHPDGRVEIIDYKFGDKNPKYIRQVAEYVDLLRRAGYKNVKGYLWYVFNDEIIEI